MIKEAFKGEKCSMTDNIGFKVMIILAIATSIDALTVGVTFAFFEINIFIAALMIGIVTFITSVIGAFLGNKFGNKYEKKAQITGGVILICLAFKNLLEYFEIS